MDGIFEIRKSIEMQLFGEMEIIVGKRDDLFIFFDDRSKSERKWSIDLNVFVGERFGIEILCMFNIQCEFLECLLEPFAVIVYSRYAKIFFEFFAGLPVVTLIDDLFSRAYFFE